MLENREVIRKCYSHNQCSTQSFGGDKVKGTVESISPNQVEDTIPKTKLHQLLYYFPTERTRCIFHAKLATKLGLGTIFSIS